MFFKAGALVSNVNKDAPKIKVGTATGDPHFPVQNVNWPGRNSKDGYQLRDM